MGAHTYSDLFHLNIHIEYIHIVLGIYISEHYLKYIYVYRDKG